MKVFVLCVLVCLSCVCAQSDQQPIKLWTPEPNDKPFRETKFGDSTKIPLEPVFKKSTVEFIKNVLAPDMHPSNQVVDMQPVPAIQPEVAAETPPAHQTLIPMNDLMKAFDRFDIDKSGKLQLLEAKNLFDEFKITFSTQAEMQKFFDRNGMMPFDLFCDLLAERKVANPTDVSNAKSAYAQQLGLDPKAMETNAVEFRVKASAVLWLRNCIKKGITSGDSPYPDPPTDQFQGSEVALAKSAIVESCTALTGRTDQVTYANAHLTKAQADSMAKENHSLDSKFCFPKKMEQCQLGITTCCDGLECCLGPGETPRSGVGFCLESCNAKK